MPPQPQQIPINIDAQNEAKGRYANLTQVAYTQEEFCLNFFSVFPPMGTLSARVIMSPGHAQKLMEALQQELAKYEKQFNTTVEPAVDPSIDPKFGFGTHGQEASKV
jgi:hypothetical protein